MSTKTFKVGEYGHCPKYILTTKKNSVQVQEINWDGKVAGVREFFFDNINGFEFYMSGETTSYYADNMVTWILASKAYKEANVRDVARFIFN